MGLLPKTQLNEFSRDNLQEDDCRALKGKDLTKRKTQATNADYQEHINVNMGYFQRAAIVGQELWTHWGLLLVIPKRTFEGNGVDLARKQVL